MSLRYMTTEEILIELSILNRWQRRFPTRDKHVVIAQKLHRQELLQLLAMSRSGIVEGFCAAVLHIELMLFQGVKFRSVLLCFGRLPEPFHLMIFIFPS